MRINPLLLPWLGNVISQAVTGFCHGGVVGGGVGVGIDDSFRAMLHVALIGGLVGSAKDVALYVNANPMPNIFAAPTTPVVSEPAKFP